MQVGDELPELGGPGGRPFQVPGPLAGPLGGDGLVDDVGVALGPRAHRPQDPGVQTLVLEGEQEADPLDAA